MSEKTDLKFMKVGEAAARQATVPAPEAYILLVLPARRKNHIGPNWFAVGEPSGYRTIGLGMNQTTHNLLRA